MSPISSHPLSLQAHEMSISAHKRKSNSHQQKSVRHSFFAGLSAENYATIRSLYIDLAAVGSMRSNIETDSIDRFTKPVSSRNATKIPSFSPPTYFNHLVSALLKEHCASSTVLANLKDHCDCLSGKCHDIHDIINATLYELFQSSKNLKDFYEFILDGQITAGFQGSESMAEENNNSRMITTLLKSLSSLLNNLKVQLWASYQIVLDLYRIPDKSITNFATSPVQEVTTEVTCEDSPKDQLSDEMDLDMGGLDSQLMRLLGPIINSILDDYSENTVSNNNNDSKGPIIGGSGGGDSYTAAPWKCSFETSSQHDLIQL